MAPDKESATPRIPLAYEKMLQMERLAGDPRASRGTRLKARMLADTLRRLVERVPEKE